MRSSFFQSPQVLVVEASAGSGKTYCLARRYVQLCLYLAVSHSVPIQSILAITFTNKATWAMKSRILEFLKRIALEQLSPSESDDILKPLGLDTHEASTLAFGLMNDVIRQYHYFQVQTIDSFVNILLVGCSFKVGLSARFKIQRNSREYLQLALDELLDQAAHDTQVYKLFEDFVRQYLFLENRTGWFPREDLLNLIVELFRQYNTYQKDLLIYPVDEDPFKRKKRIWSLIKELKGLCPPQTGKKFREHLDVLLSKANGAFDVDDLGAFWAKEDFPINKGGSVSLRLEELWDQIKSEIHDLCLLEARSIFNPYVALFERSLSCFGRLSRRDDVLFLEELNRKASSLFANDLVTVEELYFRLAARFQHYLVDEFQDTSLSQWRNLSTMVEEALSHGGSLFYVGDKKQAIYAFRGGESRLFDALQSQLAGFNVQNLLLEKNYRSHSEVINFNNRLFSLDNLRDFLVRRQQDALENDRHEIGFSQNDFDLLANTFGHAHQTQAKDLTGGVVRVGYLMGRVKEERSLQIREKLIPLIKELRGRFALKDIAILARGNKEVEEITQWLLEEGVDVSSERSSDIKNNSLINELISLLAFLYSPVDNNAFAQFCLGELISKATGLDSALLRDFLFNCARLKDAKEVSFYKEFQKVYPDIWGEYFNDFFLHAGVYPLYELISGIIQRFRCELYFPQYQGFVMHLLELVKKLEKESCDLFAFLEYFENFEGEDRFVPSPQVDALKVLTVHKAKGLEFPAVIVPYLEMDIKAGSGGRDGSQAYLLDITEDGMGLIRLKEAYRRYCPELQERYEQEYKKSFLVELNSIYVALTRAIEELYVFVPAKVGNTVNPALYLIPEDCQSLGVPVQRPQVHGVLGTQQRIKPFINNAWSGIHEEFLDQPARSTALARKGEFYHALLMHLGNLELKDAHEELARAYAKACHLFPAAGSAQEVLAGISQFLNREDVKRFFYLPAGTEVFCEKEFVNAYGDSKRIDRLIVQDSKVFIVDFKLAPLAQDEHHQQMEGYIGLIRQFYPKHEVSGHVLYLMNRLQDE